tara:strand:+ start:435 stop:1034 length:600 start_codon:yes stop_codon:yes gene_type:complete
MIKNNRWAFIHIPKNSGSNFKQYILSRNGAQNCFEKYGRHFTHQPLWWWEEKENLDGLQIVSIVRNPYSRILSLYNYLSVKQNNHFGGFDNFLKNLPRDRINDIVKEESGNFAHEIAWDVFWPQYKFLESRKEREVKVFRLEDSLQFLEKIVGYNFSETKFHERNYNKDLKTRYNKYTKSIVDELYKEDFIRFDYKTEL